MSSAICRNISLALLTAVLAIIVYGCATYEKEEYYESGQLKSREKTTGMTIRSK